VSEGSNFGFGGNKALPGYLIDSPKTSLITQTLDSKIISNDQDDTNKILNDYIEELVTNGSWILLKSAHGVHMTYLFKDKVSKEWFKVIATTDLPYEAINDPLTYRSFRLPKSQTNFISSDDPKSELLGPINEKSLLKDDEIRISKKLYNKTNLTDNFGIKKRGINSDTYRKINEKQFEFKEEDPNEALFDQFFVISKVTNTDIYSIKKMILVNKFIEYRQIPIELYERTGFLPEQGQFELFQRFLGKLIFEVVSNTNYQEYVKTKHFIDKSRLKEEDVMDDIV
jgi:hypothetical protein